MTQQQEQDWDRGWDEHKLRQMQRLAQMPLAKKLEWLEQALHVVISLARSRAAKEQARCEAANQNPPAL